MKITKTFRYRLEPNRLMRAAFARQAGSCRFIFNYALTLRKAAYENEGRFLPLGEISRMLPHLKRDAGTEWLRSANAQTLQQALRDLEKAYQHYFRRLKAGQAPGYPRFRKKGQHDSFRFPQGVKVADRRVYLPKMGWVRFRQDRALEGRILQTTVKRNGIHWFVTFTCEIEVPSTPSRAIDPDGFIGIDVGLRRFAVLSTGWEVENPKFHDRILGRIKQAQRQLSRREPGSANWVKQRDVLLRLHQRARNQRLDFVQKLSTHLVKNHDGIAVEDLNIRGMVRNHRVARSIQDAGWGLFLTMLEYKANWAGKPFVRVERFLATSQICSTCGVRKPMPLGLRTYACGACGMQVDRDWNASQNIRTAGLAVLGVTSNACGGAA